VLLIEESDRDRLEAWKAITVGRARYGQQAKARGNAGKRRADQWM
jgi:hypothetical protein